MGETTITPQDILSAADAGRAYVKHTPITPSAALSELCGGTVVLKAENLQRTGSFKIRGALNKLSTLGASAQHGVVAGSAGNHAGALAFAAKAHGVKCEIFVPSGASLSKIAACRAYGATASEGGESLDNAVAQAMERAHETGMAFCHPYDDLAVIAGQATLGLELIHDIENLRTVVIPLGGGGLAGGTAIALKQFDPSIKVIGVQVSACAPYAHSPAPTDQLSLLPTVLQ
jgi:threonine dehydratase